MKEQAEEQVGQAEEQVDFSSIVRSEVSKVDWSRIVRTAVREAKKGNDRARAFLEKHLIPVSSGAPDASEESADRAELIAEQCRALMRGEAVPDALPEAREYVAQMAAFSPMAESATIGIDPELAANLQAADTEEAPPDDAADA